MSSLRAHRSLYLRAQPFRFGCYWAMACVCLALLPSARPWWQLVLAALFCVAWPLVERRLTGRFARSAQVRAVPYAAMYGAECLVTGAFLSWASLPPLAGAAVVVGLLAGAAAQAGHRLMLQVLPALCAGILAGTAASPALTRESTLWADTLAMALLLGFTVCLATLSFRRACRLSASRRALASHSQTVERLNARLEHYVPQSLRLRLQRTPEARCTWERRWLTVAFVDLVGFTALAEKIDAEVLAELLNDYLQALSGAVTAHRGELSKLLGDGALVAFGLSPGASRRAAALDCLVFCQQIPDILHRLSNGRRLQGEILELNVRAGVASGHCTLGDWGGNGRLDFTMIGTPVNLASRLQAHADDNGFIADAATAALAEPDVALRAPVPLQLRGLGTVWAHRSVDQCRGSAMVPAARQDTARKSHSQNTG